MREKLEKRLEKLKEAQQKDLAQLNKLSDILKNIERNITIRSGRIAELEEMLKPEIEEEKE